MTWLVLAATILSVRADALSRSPAPHLLRTSALHYTLALTAEDLTIERRDGFDVVRLPGCDLAARPGEPALPSFTLRIALPPGMEARQVEIISAEYVELPGTFRILPGQWPRAIDGTGEKRARVAPDDAIYSSSAPFPSHLAELLHQADLAGQAIAFVRLHPVQYMPQTGRVRLASSIEFRLAGEHGFVCRDYLPPRTSPAVREGYRRALQAVVVNPADICLTTVPQRDSRLTPGAYDYVIVTRAEWTDDFQPLADWRTQQGLRATIVTTEWILEESGYSGTDLERMRAFITDAHASWGAAYFQLGADVPTLPYHVRTITVPGYGTDEIPNYTYFADYDDDWVCEVHIGNASVRTAPQVADFIDKLFAYEKTPPLIDYAATALFLGFDISWCGDTYGEEFSEHYIRADFLPDDWTLDTEYDSEPGLHKADVIAFLQQGPHLVNHIDHCNTDVMGTGWICHGQLLQIPEVYALNNGERQGILFAVGCYPADFTVASCIGEVFQRHTAGGTIAFFGNTGIGWGGSEAEMNLHTLRQDYYFYRNLFELDIARIGENFTLLKNDEYDPNDPFNLHQYCFTQLHLLGDPGMPVWTADPQALTVSHAGTIAGGHPCDYEVAVSGPGGPLDAATVCLWKGDEFYEVAATVSGVATFALPALGEGRLLVTVTKHNYLPYEGQAVVEMDPMPTPAAEERLPQQLALAAFVPTPSSGTTCLTLAVPAASASPRVTLAIYDCQGRRVRTLWDGPLAAGTYRHVWDGRDDERCLMPSGIYFGELRQGDARVRQSVLILR